MRVVFQNGMANPELLIEKQGAIFYERLMPKLFDVDEVHFQRSKMLVLPTQSFHGIKFPLSFTDAFANHSMSPFSNLLHNVVLIIKFCLLLIGEFIVFRRDNEISLFAPSTGSLTSSPDFHSFS